MMNKAGLFVVKKEMSKVWLDGKFTAVTLVTLPQQEIVAYKTEEKDGYMAAIVGVEKKELDKAKGQKIKYTKLGEFRNIDETFVADNQVGKQLDLLFVDADVVSVVGMSLGKGFQGVMKRFHAKGGPKTHGSKFHRQIGSLGNRKPRRVQKGHPHAGRMGGQQITLKNIR
ncbi:MAG: 50S ribosomal protein L3, partial [candidate division SR1 bacterium]